MGKGVILEGMLIVILFSISVVSGQGFLSPSEGTDVEVTVDGEFPVINILSPKNTTYNNATPLLVNYTVFDLTLDSVWYSLNGGKNLSVSGLFNLELAEGDYVLRIYANDSFNRVNFSEVSFSINNSAAFCGNGVCDAGEDCNSCPEDCGACAQPSSSGGNGGGSRIRETIDFNLVPDKIKLSLRQGHTKRESIIITNTENKKISVSLSFPEMENLIKMSERNFELGPKESKVVVLDFIATENTVPNLYLNKLVVKSDGTTKDVLVAIEIESKESLFDVKVEIPEGFLEALPGEELFANIKIISLGEAKKKDIKIEYFIKNEENDIILTETETIIIETEARFVKSFEIPLDAKSGTYVLYVKTTEGESSASASAWFLVKRKLSILKIILLIFLIILIILILVFSDKKNRKKIRRIFKKLKQKIKKLK